MTASAAAVAAEAAVVAAAEATEHLLQTLLRARETHARTHTARQGEPVGEDSGETPSLGVAARQEGSLDASCAVVADGQSRRMEQSLLSGLGPRPARFECRRRGGAGAGPSWALHEHVCARRRSVGRSPFRADVGFGAECTPCTRIASTTSQSRPGGMASPDDDGRRHGAEERAVNSGLSC